MSDDGRSCDAAVKLGSLTSSCVDDVDPSVFGGYQNDGTPTSFARFESFWSKVAMAS